MKSWAKLFHIFLVTTFLATTVVNPSYAAPDLLTDDTEHTMSSLLNIQASELDPNLVDTTWIDWMGNSHNVRETFAYFDGERKLARRDFLDQNSELLYQEFEYAKTLAGLVIYCSKEKEYYRDGRENTNEYRMLLGLIRQVAKNTYKESDYVTYITDYDWRNIEVRSETQRHGVLRVDQNGDRHEVTEITIREYESTFWGTYLAKTIDTVSGITIEYNEDGSIANQTTPQYIPKKVYLTYAEGDFGGTVITEDTYTWLFDRYLHTESVSHDTNVAEYYLDLIGYYSRYTIEWGLYEWGDVYEISSTYYKYHKETWNGQEITVEEKVSRDESGMYTQTTTYGDFRVDIFEFFNRFRFYAPVRFSTSSKTITESGQTEWITDVTTYASFVLNMVPASYVSEFYDGLTGSTTHYTAPVKATVYMRNGQIIYDSIHNPNFWDYPDFWENYRPGDYMGEGILPPGRDLTGSRDLPPNLPETKIVRYAWGEIREYRLMGDGYRETKRINNEYVLETFWSEREDGKVIKVRDVQYGTHNNLLRCTPADGYKIVTEYGEASSQYASYEDFYNHYNEVKTMMTKRTIYGKTGKIEGSYEPVFNTDPQDEDFGQVIGYRVLTLAGGTGEVKYIVREVTFGQSDTTSVLSNKFLLKNQSSFGYKFNAKDLGLDGRQAAAIVEYINQLSKKDPFSKLTNPFESKGAFENQFSRSLLTNSLSNSERLSFKASPNQTSSASSALSSNEFLKSHLFDNFTDNGDVILSTNPTSDVMPIETTKVRTGELSVADIMDMGSVKASFDASSMDEISVHGANIKDMSSPMPRVPGAPMADLSLSPTDSSDDANASLSVLNETLNAHMDSRVALLGSLNSDANPSDQNASSNSSSSMTMEAYLSGSSPVSKSLDRLLKKNPSLSIDAMKVKLEEDEASKGSDMDASLSSKAWKDEFTMTAGKRLPTIPA